MKIEYRGSVLTPAGFRGVTFTARVKKLSEKRVQVLEILQIEGEDVRTNMSRTGANRQKFYGIGAAAREEGAIKNLSACRVLAE